MNIKYLRLFRERFSITKKKDFFIIEDKKMNHSQYCSHYNECVFYMFYWWNNKIYRIWRKRRQIRNEKWIKNIWNNYNKKFGTNINWP